MEKWLLIFSIVRVMPDVRNVAGRQQYKRQGARHYQAPLVTGQLPLC
jgi:hypothetical protein